MDIQTLEFTLARLADANRFDPAQTEALQLARNLVAEVRQGAELEPSADAAVLLQRAGKARVLAMVDGGVASYLCDPVVEVEIFDWDDYRRDPTCAVKPPSYFADLATSAGIPIGDA